jgi:endonuclease/exonuclease/phosphatase family metal-dependent hydrolase
MRVATFNIHHGVGQDGVLDLDRTARTLAATGGDLIGLQEVDRHFGARSGWMDQAAWLGEKLGMQVVFGANLDLSPPEPGAPRRQYGNALLSAYDILDWHNILLPRLSGDEQRGLLDVLVDAADGSRTHVLVTHLQHDSRTARLLQVDAIRQVLASSEPPVVLVGDLNSRPDSPEIRQLTEVLVDAWATAGQGPGYTFSARRPHARIDYVMSSDDLFAWGAEVLWSRAADHLPVVADLQSAGPEWPG